MTYKPTIVVPARLESTRFNHKLLHEINGKPLILWTADRIKEQAPEYPLYFAVDAPELEKCLVDHGFRVIMTSKEHLSGTDRIAEANKQIGAKYLINVQGDEPLIQKQAIELLADNLMATDTMVTLATPFKTREDFEDPNQVKVILDESGHALYFSRAAIPYNRDTKGGFPSESPNGPSCYKHIGLYGYTKTFLERFVSMEVGELESCEKLEQLRVLEKGYKIQVAISETQTIGIDTQADIDVFKSYLSS